MKIITLTTILDNESNYWGVNVSIKNEVGESITLFYSNIYDNTYASDPVKTCKKRAEELADKASHFFNAPIQYFTF